MLPALHGQETIHAWFVGFLKMLHTLFFDVVHYCPVVSDACVDVQIIAFVVMIALMVMAMIALMVRTHDCLSGHDS